jgi:hypothetical protein
MRERPPFIRRVTLLQVTVAIVTIATVVALVWAIFPNALVPEEVRLLRMVSSFKHIHLAAYQMGEDHNIKQDPRLGWPGDLAASSTAPVRSLSEYIDRIVELGYMPRRQAGQIFAANRSWRYSGPGPFKSEHSPLKIYHVKESDPPECLFGASKNFRFGIGLDQKGLERGVVFQKGGSGSIISREAATNTRSIGLMPGATSRDNPGKEDGNFWD